MINEVMLRIMDGLLGWLLYLPRDVALLFVAALTAGVLTIVRRCTTDQDFLKRCRDDKRTLKRLIRQARRAKDRSAVARYRQTRSQIAFKGLAQEGKPLVMSIVPIVFLAVWCFGRLGYYPPKADEPVEVRAYFPVSAAGEIVYLTPQEGLTTGDGWLKEIQPATIAGQPPHGRATWTVRGLHHTDPYPLVIRRDDDVYRHELLIGRKAYTPVAKRQDNQSKVRAVEVLLKPYRPLGLVPGIGVIGLAPWLVGYLIMVIPLAWALRKWLKVA
jgi:uncharacterized membrane protein (DUF106 family)